MQILLIGNERLNGFEQGWSDLCLIVMALFLAISREKTLKRLNAIESNATESCSTYQKSASFHLKGIFGTLSCLVFWNRKLCKYA